MLASFAALYYSNQTQATVGCSPNSKPAWISLQCHFCTSSWLGLPRSLTDSPPNHRHAILVTVVGTRGDFQASQQLQSHTTLAIIKRIH